LVKAPHPEGSKSKRIIAAKPGVNVYNSQQAPACGGGSTRYPAKPIGQATAAPARELWNELAEHHLVSLSMSTHQEAITSKVKKTAGELFHHGWKVNPIDCRVVQVTVR